MTSAPRRLSFQRMAVALASGAVLALGCFALAVAVGEQVVDWGDVLSPDSAAHTIVFRLRLPRVVLAAIVGAALAASGAVLQCLLRNPLADPFVLGVSGGAAVGATAALAFGFSVSWLAGFSAVSFAALAGAAAATLLVLAIGRSAGGDEASSTMLVGVIFNSIALALILLLRAVAAPDRLGAVVFWLAGTLGYEAPVTLAAAAAVVGASLVVMTVRSPALNVLLLGDEDARSLGVDVRATRSLLFGAASAAVAAAVSLSGLIGFVGLLVPHVVRALAGEDQRLVVPMSAIAGAAFLMVADLGARLLFRVLGTEPPVGVVTALLGGPVFLALLVHRGRARRR